MARHVTQAMFNYSGFVVALGVVHVIFLASVSSETLSSTVATNATTDTITELNRRIADLQVKHDHDIGPPFGYVKKRGVYESNIRVNTFGQPWLAAFRQFGVFDNNAFTTAWVTMCLLEAREYGTNAPAPGVEQMKMALELISSHHDKNDPPGSGAVNFWQQSLNHSSGLWTSQPTNIISIVDILSDLFPWNLLEEICQELGPSVAEACEVIALFKSAKNEILPEFKIPADFDDTFVNIGLGALLKRTRAHNPQLYDMWTSSNTNTKTAFQLLKMYAYRPMSKSLANIIDQRTYYYTRGFLEKAKDEVKEVALVTTWIQNLTQERQRFYEGVSMPFHVNNVDCTVAANVVYGITAALLENLFELDTWLDQDVAMVYENTTSLIEWVINSGTITNRTDLALTYYPSRYNFYWFVSRTRFIIANRIANNYTLPKIPSLRFVYDRLNGVLRSRVTADILAEAKTEGGKWAYFDDFLGDADETWERTPKPSADDRLFTTSMAVNTLIATWTTQDESKRLIWAKETPPDVIRIVQQAASWLNEFVLSGKYKPLNAFFSGSIKSNSTIPFFYPFNFLEYLNGTKLPLNDTHVHIGFDLVLAMSGVVPKDQYNKMIRELHFGYHTPTKFPGYNKSNFPFWSSAAYTYASTLLALSQYLNLAQ